MKTLSVKNLKKETRTICEFAGKKQTFSDTTQNTTTGDTTTVLTTTVTHLK